ncbi:MAG: hypothetical protein DSM106950_14180 [Stigonema ocellatum SAG 48.90 = DSM 106950]|nr:hypothetical protein [Stigonema ocellatum SAG 48.90 = DSM 106950]
MDAVGIFHQPIGSVRVRWAACHRQDIRHGNPSLKVRQLDWFLVFSGTR